MWHLPGGMFPDETSGRWLPLVCNCVGGRFIKNTSCTAEILCNFKSEVWIKWSDGALDLISWLYAWSHSSLGSTSLAHLQITYFYLIYDNVVLILPTDILLELGRSCLSTYGLVLPVGCGKGVRVFIPGMHLFSSCSELPIHFRISQQIRLPHYGYCRIPYGRAVFLPLSILRWQLTCRQSS